MAIRREDSASKLQDFQIGSSWIPATPTKPGPPNQLSIDTNQSVRSTLADWTAQANVSESESITENFLQEFDSWQAREGANSRVYGEKSCIYDNFPINAAEQWTNMPFGKLLALAEANVGNKTAIENTLTHHFATSSSSASYLHQQTEGGQFTVSIGDSSERDQCSLLAANFDAESKISDFVSNGSSTPWNFFNLDSPPRTIAGAALAKSALSQVEPVTPEKTNKESVMKDTSIEEVPANKENEVTTGVMELHEKKDTNQLCEATSTKLQENHKPDKGVSEEASLSKTPQQKTRRKKHRPKVIIEGQQRRTPKSSAEKPSVAHKTTRAKRNYVRKNGANTPVGVANGTDLDTKTPSSLETPGKKRKYTRKIINKPEDNMDKGTPETTDMKTPRQHSQRSCRRSLNFDSDGQMRDGSSTYFPSPNCDKVSQAENFDAKDQPRATPCMQETGVVLRKDDMVTSHEVSNSMNQVHEEYLPMPEQHYQSSLPSANKNHMLTDQIVCARGKCQILFSDVTHDKEPRVVQVTMNPYSQLTFGSLGDSICSSPCLTPEKQVRGLKRQSACTTVEAELCSRNETGIFYNSLQAYRTILFQNADKISGTSGLHFPVIYKKKRTDKEHNTVTSSIQIKVSTSDNHACVDKQSLKYSCTKLCTSAINQGLCGARGQVNNLLTNATNGTQNGRQVFEDLLALGPTRRIRKRKSKGPTRVRKIASLLEELPAFPSKAATARIKQDIEIQHQPYTCMEALVADTHSTTITKKRSKRSMLNNSTVQHMYSYHKFSPMSMGPPLALTWKSMSPVDSIIDQLNGLDLNAESSRASERKCNALMSCCRYYQEPHDIVPFQNSSAVVPFDISFDQVRRRRQRPIVDLDDETTRVWNLLLENINSEGIDGTDEEKTKWWEEERRVFRGRTDSFIARMHLIQGDRRFSPWKGSVVDSVVGVFLTQNVSDHLSSSAFMSLAARYPLKSKINQPELHEEGLGTIINEPKVCVLESNGTFGLNGEILHQSVCGEDTKMLQNFEDDGIREVNSSKPSGKDIGGIILKDNLRGQSNDNPGHGGPDTSCEISTNKSLSLIEDGRDIEDTLSSQNSANSPITQTTERTDSCLMSTTEEPTVGVKPNRPTNSGSFVKLLQMAGTVLHGVYGRGSEKRKSDESQHAESESLASDLQAEDHLGNPIFPAKVIASYTQPGLCHVPNSGVKATDFDSSQRKNKFSDSSSYKELCTAEISELSSESACGTTFQKITAVRYEEVQKISSPNAHSSNNEQIEINKIIVGNQTGQALAQNKMQGISKNSTHPQSLIDATGSTSNIDISKNLEHKGVNSNKNDHPGNMVNGPKAKGGRPKKEKGNQGDWDHLRKQTRVNGRERARTANTLDSVDWEAIRCADVNEIAETIKERGMNNVLAERIKDFLDRLVRDHGSIDLEWLRDVPPDKAKEYLLSIRGLGLKSVECVRLLTLHHLAFPVDTNVGRIAVRLGWVPLQPLPESLQLHLLELYPVLESIQKYLWPRLCKLDQRTLYELHYQMITFGKVFCTKSKPNCNACPMRGECRHFASAFASARLALPAPEDKSIVSATVNRKADQNPIRSMSTLQLPSSQAKEMDPKSGLSNCQPIIEEPYTPEPIIEVPATPEPDLTQVPECDIESAFCEDPDEIPTIQLNMEEFTHNLQTFMQQNSELQEGDMSKALVALTSAAASIPVPKLKNVSRLRTEHQVYELPDSHPLLDGMDKREPDDPCPYLLAIWTPGETMNSIEPPERRCISQEFEGLCSDETCLSCNSIREVNSQTVRGTLLIPCRTAMRGSFPLNGTYFQVNEVFSDHESSLSPIDVPRKWLWNLPRRTVYFGTSIPTIFKGLSTEGIQYCFWRGFVCVRGFDRETRAPRPLIARLHFPASKLAKGKGKIDEDHR